MKTLIRLILKPFFYFADIMDEMMDEDLERRRNNEGNNRRA